MWIKRIELRNFRGVSGACDLAPGRLNVIRLGNGAGKTTIADAALTALFGPEGPDTVPPDGTVELVLSDVAGRQTTLRGTTGDGSRRGIPRDAYEFCCGLSTRGASRVESLLDAQAEHRRTDPPAAIARAQDLLTNLTVATSVLEGAALPIRQACEQLDLRIAGLENELRAVENARTHAIEDGRAAERLRQEARAQEKRREEYQRAALAAELREIRETLLRLESGEEADARRQERMARLQEEGVVSPEERPEVERLLAELRRIWNHAADARQTAEALRAASPGVDLTDLRPRVTAEELEHLRNLRLRIVELREAIEDRRRRLESDYPVSSGEEALAAEDDALLSKVESLPDDLRTEALALAEEYADLEVRLQEAEADYADSRRTVETSRGEKERLGALSAASVAVAAVGSVAGVVLWLTALPMAAAATGALALGVGATGLEIAGRKRRKVTARLDPAMAQEVTLSGMVTRLRERLDSLGDSVHLMAHRTGIPAEDLFHLSEISRRGAERAPRRRAEAELKQLESDLATAELEAYNRSAGLLESATAPAADDDVLGRLTLALERGQQHLQEQGEMVRLQEQLRQAEEDRNRYETQFRDQSAAFLARLAAQPGFRTDRPLSSEPTLAGIEAAAEAFLAACARGEEYRELEEQMRASRETSPEERRAALHARLAELEVSGGAVEEVGASGESSAELRRKAAESAQRAADLESRAQEAYERGLTAITTARQQSRGLRETIARLSRVRDHLARYAAAAELVTGQLQECVEQELGSWRGEIADRAGALLEAAGHGLTDYTWSAGLADPPQARSTRTGRQLGPSDLAGLGTGVLSQSVFALRLAVAEQLAEGSERLPLILDEPFAAWDDERFVTGIRWLVDYASAGGQVVLLTSHASRLAELDRSHFELARELHLVWFK